MTSLGLFVLIGISLHILTAVNSASAVKRHSTPGDASRTGAEQRPARRQLRDSDWKPAHYQIYDAKAQPIPSEIVLELLEELERVYEPFDDLETNRRKTKIGWLLTASRLGPHQCNEINLNDFSVVINYNSPYKRTLWPYLYKHLDEYLSMCRRNIIWTLHYNVDNMNEAHWADMHLLAQILLMTQVGHTRPLNIRDFAQIDLFPDHLAEALLKYLGIKSDNNLDELVYIRPKSGRPDFYELYANYVHQTCVQWRFVTDTLELFAPRNHSVERVLTTDETNWVLFGKLCQYICHTGDLASSLYEKLKISKKLERLELKSKEKASKKKKGFFKLLGNRLNLLS